MRNLVAITLLLGMAACASPPKGTVRPRTEPAAVPKPTSSSPSRVVNLAEAYLGTPYRYGGSTRQGMDCSGLVLRVYSEAGVKLPRTSASQYRVGQPVAKKELIAGDLVFFANSNGQVNHVGIYAGAGRFIHASTGKRKVRYDELSGKYFAEHYVGAKRVRESAR